MSKCLVVLTVAYVVGALGTFAWVQDHEHFSNSSDRDICSVLCSGGWPIFWAAKSALAIDDALTSAVQPPKTVCRSSTGEWPPRLLGAAFVCDMSDAPVKLDGSSSGSSSNPNVPPNQNITRSCIFNNSGLLSCQ